VVEIGAQLALTGGTMLLTVAAVLLCLEWAACVRMPLPDIDLRVRLWPVVLIGAKVRLSAGLLTSTPSRAPPMQCLRQIERTRNALVL